jgi:hypothetical protein
MGNSLSETRQSAGEKEQAAELQLLSPRNGSFVVEILPTTGAILPYRLNTRVRRTIDRDLMPRRRNFESSDAIRLVTARFPAPRITVPES